MLVKSKPVALSSFDLDSLDESDDNHEAIEFDILLNDSPDNKWCEEFEIAYRVMPNNIKPPVHINEDRMRIAYLPRYERDLPSYIDYLKSVVAVANEEVRKTEAIAKHSHRAEHIESFRTTLRRMRLD